jgi:tetratricopeptide (TPR) repeat protein
MRACGLLAGQIRSLAIAVAFAPAAFGAEDFATRLARADEADQRKECEKILAEWGKKAPDNPDYYIKGANYYYRRAMRGGVNISTKPAAPGEPVISDLKGNEVDSVSPALDLESMNRAIKLLAAAAERFPRRMDIWFGRVQLYEAAGMNVEQLEMLKSIAAHVAAHPNGLLGHAGQPFQKPVRETTAKELSGFARNCYRRETKEGDQQFLAIARLTTEAFPEAVYGYNLLGTYYSAVEPDQPRAIENFRKALTIAPEDSLVLCNLGEAYLGASNPAEARLCFEKVVTLNNNEESVQLAKDALGRMSK